MNFKAISLTEKSWILYHNQTRVGLMNKGDTYNIISGEYKGEYPTIEDMESKIGKILFEAPKKQEEKCENFIDTYPVRHNATYNVINISDKNLYPTYTKMKNSRDVYAAGYFSIKTENNVWVTKLCPRVKTLENNEFAGPFKTKFEADHAHGVGEKK